MSISQTLLPEFDQEMASTRKLLEVVPEDKFDYKPHEKSMAMGRLAGHVAELPLWAATTIKVDELNIQPGDKPFEPATKAELLATFDKNAAEARKTIAEVSDEHLAKPWTLKFSGKEIFTMPRFAILRSMAMNHLIHHRAQLGVYLRLNDIPIPGMYGASADEAQYWK